MFNIFKKNSNIKYLKAIVNGNAINIDTVPDEIFSSKAMGDGIAFEPEDNIVVAPCDCTVISMSKDMKHACGLKLSNGLEILIHIGIDTVRLNGNGFTQFVKEGDKVKEGEPLIEFNSDIIKSNGLCDNIMMIITDSSNISNFNINTGAVKKSQDIVISW